MIKQSLRFWAKVVAYAAPPVAVLVLWQSYLAITDQPVCYDMHGAYIACPPKPTPELLCVQ
jgi:hypothetical protein